MINDRKVTHSPQYVQCFRNVNRHSAFNTILKEKPWILGLEELFSNVLFKLQHIYIIFVPKPILVDI